MVRVTGLLQDAHNHPHFTRSTPASAHPGTVPKRGQGGRGPLVKSLAPYAPNGCKRGQVQPMATIPAGFRVTHILHLKCTRIRHFRTKISTIFRVGASPSQYLNRFSTQYLKMKLHLCHPTENHGHPSGPPKLEVLEPPLRAPALYP